MSTAEDLVRHPEEEARRILRRRRKTTRTSCYPCRSRKVRCDKQLPCNTCVQRGYPELCSYTNPTREVSTSASIADTQPSPSRQHEFERPQNDPVWDSPKARGPGGLSPLLDDRQDHSEALMEEANLGGSRRDPFLGTNSMPSFIRQQESHNTSTQNTPSRTVEHAILPILGLEDSTASPYPFLPTSQASVLRPSVEIELALPADREIIRLFQLYRQESHSFSPIIPDIDNFEDDLCKYLDDRSARVKVPSIPLPTDDQSPPRSQSEAWIGSLYAVLASGIQYSTLSLSERLLKCRLYIQNSFQCLRVANFLARPSLVSLQTLLILGNVLQNDMQPEAAWILLGTTGRVAQSLGLHQEGRMSDSEALSRNSLWRAVLWQDSLLSLCFDRIPIMAPTMIDFELPDNLSYINAMQALSNMTLEHLSRKSYNQPPNYAAIIESVSKVENIQYKSLYATNNAEIRHTIQQRCERFTLSLHVSFVAAWICRPAFRSRPNLESITELRQSLIEKCRDNLITCVQAFIKLHRLRVLSSRSWTILHNGLSSALLMSLLNFGTRTAEAHRLQGEVVDTLSSEESDTSTSTQRQEENGNIKLSGPHMRILTVLKKLYSDRNVNPEGPVTGYMSSHQLQPTVVGNVPNQPFLAPDERLYPEVDPVWLASPNDMNRGNISPLDYFDSLLWDPVETQGPMIDQTFW